MTVTADLGLLDAPCWGGRPLAGDRSVELLAASEYFDVPTNPNAKVHPLVKPYQSAKLIDFDFKWAGDTSVRQKIVERFTNDILAGRKLS